MANGMANGVEVLMPKAYVFLSLLVIATLTSCQRDPRSIRITEANKDSYLEELKDLRGLTVEENQLLISYELRRGLGGLLGLEPPQHVGKTVGQILEEQRAFQESAKAAEVEQARLAAEAKAKQDAQAEQLRSSIALAVYEKGFVESNWRANQYKDLVTIECTYENKSSRDIRAFTGTIRFNDLFDRKLFESSITISDPVAAGTRGTWSGGIEYNEFVDEHQALRNTPLENMKVVWLPASILFADGSRLGE
jgi:hypothetical protein